MELLRKSQHKIQNLENEVASIKADNMHQVRVSNFQNRRLDFGDLEYKTFDIPS